MNQTLGQKLFRTKSAERTKLDEGNAHGASLGRSLGLFPLTMIGVGATIGTGIFFTTVEAVPKAGPAVVLSFLMAAITAGLTALCYAELADRVPASGSSYSFAHATVGEFAAFVVAACLLLEYGLAASATAIGWSDYLNNFLQNALGWQIPEALRSPLIVAGKNGGVEFHAGHINLPPILLVVLCCVLLIRGTQESATTNAIMVLIKLAILVFFAAIALTGFDINNFHPFFAAADSHSLGGMAVGILIGFLLLSGVLTNIQRFPVRDYDKTIDESKLGAFLADNFDVVIRGLKLIPGDWDNEIDKLAN